MDVVEVIRKRRSIRSFKKKEIPAKILAKILEAATWAPSAGNLQNWEFILIKDENAKRRIAEIAFGQSFVAEADVIIVACSNQNKISRYGERGEKLYAIQNVAAAIQNILLAASYFGIGSCWVGAFDDKELKKFLELPPHVIPHAIIPLGYPSEKPNIPKRVSWKEITFLEKYNKKYIL